MGEKRPCPSCATPLALHASDCEHCGARIAVGPPGPPSPHAEHLKLLAIGHYVIGAMIGFFSCIPLIHVAVGAALLFAPETMSKNGNHPPVFFGLIFMVLGLGFVLTGWAVATLLLIAGRSIARRRRHTLCLVAAGLSCMFMPFGTVLGVFSFVTLLKPEVRALFDPPRNS